MSSGEARWLSAELESKPATRGGVHRIQPVLRISLAVGRCGDLSTFFAESRWTGYVAMLVACKTS